MADVNVSIQELCQLLANGDIDGNVRITLPEGVTLPSEDDDGSDDDGSDDGGDDGGSGPKKVKLKKLCRLLSGNSVSGGVIVIIDSGLLPPGFTPGGGGTLPPGGGGGFP